MVVADALKEVICPLCQTDDGSSAADTDIAGQAVLLLSTRRDCAVSCCPQIVEKLTRRGRRAAEYAEQDLACVVDCHTTVNP